MSEIPAAVEQGYTLEEAAALGQMADALARFSNAIDVCADAGIGLPAALTACGVQVPTWAAPALSRLVAPQPAA